MSDERLLEKLMKSVEKDPKMLVTIKAIYDHHDKVFRCQRCGSSNLERISALQYRCRECGSAYLYTPFSPSDMTPQPPFSHILELISLGVIEAVHGGSRKLSYVPAKPEILKWTLENKGFVLGEAPVIGEPEPGVEELPEDFRSLLNDFKSILFLITKSIRSESSAHFLLIGPRISLKGLIIEELQRIPSSYLYVPGNEPSLDEVLWGVRPNPLIIPNFERVRSSVDLSTLANLLSSGKLFVRKVGEVLNYRSTVTASAMSERGIPRDLTSYFISLYLPPIEDDALRKRIIAKIIMERSGKDEGFSNYVAEKSSAFTEFGFREFLELAKLCDDRGCVDNVVSLLMRYSKPVAKKRRRR
ncbi:MAG: hypothetical protein QW280_01550 [Candidatus Korarchaeum sp.]